MPGINDAFKNHCAKSSADIGKRERQTPERTDETPPCSDSDSFSNVSGSASFQIIRKSAAPSVSSAPVRDCCGEKTITDAFGGGTCGPSGFEPPSCSSHDPEPSCSSHDPEPPLQERSNVDSLRDKTQDLPPLWGVDLVLILVSVAGLTAIALHFQEILIVIALGVYRLFDAALWTVLPILALLLLLRVLLGRR